MHASAVRAAACVGLASSRAACWAVSAGLGALAPRPDRHCEDRLQHHLNCERAPPIRTPIHTRAIRARFSPQRLLSDASDAHQTLHRRRRRTPGTIGRIAHVDVRSHAIRPASPHV
eukprot:3012621-Pleurochrysis_carterae.AAC.2